VVEGLLKAQAMAEEGYQGLVVWSPDEMFSAGADLQSMLPAFMMGGAKAIEGAEAELQNAMLALRYANVPVVSAIRGLALGGGCELAVYSARVAAMESYIGLVEVGVGLVPGAGGLTYIARRAAENMALVHLQGRAALPDRRLHRRRHGQGGHQRAGKRASWATCWRAT
jgi:3-hydroxyacyl-CoA dehydrogenase